jgi:DNA-binding NarL/FixJ family response regulator
MSLSISSSLSTVALSLATANSSATSAAARTPQPTKNDSGDTVRLSESQQVYQLYNQGQQVSQIAASLSLPVETVNNYLGISAAAG